MIDRYFQLFSKVVSTGVLDLSEKERIKVLEYLKKQNYINAGIDIDDEDLSLSSNEMYLLNKPELKFLKSKITKCINDFMKDTMKYNQNDFEITTSWVAKSKPGNKSHWHNHNNCFYSGVYYVDTHKNCGNLKFSLFQNKRNNLIVSEQNILNSDDFFIEPSDNKIVLFPAEMFHEVGKNKSEKDRYSIAFNIVPVGIIGRGDSELKTYNYNA